MMGWNPDQHQAGEQSDGDYDERVVPSGEYVVGLTWWNRISGKAVKVRAEVLAGPLKGASCFTMISTNVAEKKGSADRMFHICKSFHITGDLEFDAPCFAFKFVGSAGKVRIHKSTRGNFTNHDIKKAFHRGECSEAERAIMVEWQDAYASKRDDRGNTSNDGWADDGAPFPDDGGGGGFQDDDIPF
jgi:hypothetical protein